MKINFIHVLFLGTLATLSAYAQKGDSPIQVTDLTRIRQINSIQVKPNGEELAYAVRAVAVDTSKKGGYRYETIWFIKSLLSNKPAERIDEKKQISQVLYGPDGRRWAIGKDKKKQNQLFTYPDDGTAAVQVTDLAKGLGQVRFSPNGSKVLLSQTFTLRELVADSSFNAEGALPNWSIEKPGDAPQASLRRYAAVPNADGNRDEIAAYLLQNEEKTVAKLTNKLQFQTENSTTGELRFTHWYLLDLANGQRPVAVSKGFRTYSGAEFLTEQKLLFTVESDSTAHPDRVSSTNVFLWDRSTDETRRLVGDGIHRYQVAAVSPSGQHIAVSKGKQNSLTLGELILYDTKEWQAKPIVFDRALSQVQFAPDGKSLYFIAASHGGRAVYRFGIRSAKATELTSEDVGIGDYWVGAGKTIFSKTTFSNPAELYVGNLDFQKEKALTDLHASWLSGRDVGIPEKHTLRNELGLEVDYWLLKPAGYEAGRQYPLLVEIHGGPASMFGPADASMWHEYQYFRSRGYAVLFSNPRGSSGYGEAFLKANFKDWGAGPARDVLEAVDRSVATGWIDSTQLYVTGGSYGAYLTTWLLAHDQRFRAASSQRGVYDLYVFFGSGNVWPMLKRYFGGFPWEEGMAELLHKQSPTTYVQQIKTPLLIFHGEQDNRTGPVQSDFLYKQLKVLERPVEYVRHPGADHEITRSGDVGQRIDQLLRTYEFFERYRKR